jgi:hypothetical protein
MVVTPLVWLLVAVGQGATGKALPSESSTPGQLIVGGSVLVGVGLLAGLIASLRTSPTGAMFGGLIFVLASTYMYMDHVRGLKIFTTYWEVKGYPVNLATPLTSGVLAFAGGMLLMSIFSGARWRGRNVESDPDTWHPIPPEEDFWSYR